MVKKWFKYFSVLLILIVGVLVFNQNISNGIGKGFKIKETAHFNNNTSVSLEQINGIPFAENLQLDYYNTPNLNFNQRFVNNWVYNQIANHLVITKLKQYCNTTYRFLVYHRKTHIIFPFHYFW